MKGAGRIQPYLFSADKYELQYDNLVAPAKLERSTRIKAHGL